jgi:1-acyl-sn-glycerol-3-phosphate acyltransferase
MGASQEAQALQSRLGLSMIIVTEAKTMNDTLYHFLTGVLDLFVWGGELVGEENLPQRGPAVFVANHLGSLGPIAAVCSIPLRLNPWIIADMVDPDLAPAYLEWDFIQRNFPLKPPLSKYAGRVLAKITVPLLRSLGCIPVYKGYENMHKTWEQSLAVLLEDKFLLIFPEDANIAYDPVTKMSAFQKSFVRLGEMYYEKTGRRLMYYPVAIHGSGIVMVGQPVLHNPLNRPGLERHRLKDLMEDAVRAMYLKVEGERTGGVLTPEHK